MNQAIIDRYRCPEQFVPIGLNAPLSDHTGFFRFTPDLICYGRSSFGTPCARPAGPLPDLGDHASIRDAKLFLPFDPSEIVANLTYERYMGPHHGEPPTLAKSLYYLIRPWLPRCLRIPVQRVYFRSGTRIPFPSWPVDLTVEKLLERVLLLALKAGKRESIPFIWFWPDGASSATILTHDVETVPGRDFCGPLMDLDEAFDVRGSFQIIPEQRYPVSPSFLEEIRGRGHEINVHDLNHDGHLFRDRARFLSRVSHINRYGRQFGARGFRAAVLYRNQDWFDQLDFEYDMSVPNVGHLEAQRGGCCTVFPYFVGRILEIPLTTIQDYALFHILRDYRIDLWKLQASAIIERHGLLSFGIHPDYISEPRLLAIYRSLLEFLRHCQAETKTWITTADQVNTWWRQRAEMSLVFQAGSWRIEGEGKERAQIAYATAEGEALRYIRPGSGPSGLEHKT